MPSLWSVEACVHAAVSMVRVGPRAITGLEYGVAGAVELRFMGGMEIRCGSHVRQSGMQAKAFDSSDSEKATVAIEWSL